MYHILMSLDVDAVSKVVKSHVKGNAVFSSDPVTIIYLGFTEIGLI